MSIQHIPTYDRPREKLVEVGVKNLTDNELIAIILRSGTSRTSVMKIATSLMRKISLKDMSSMKLEDLQKIGGIGSAYAASLIAAVELSHRVNDTQDVLLTQPEQILLHVSHLAMRKQEHFVCLYINARYNLLKKSTVSIGTIDASLAHPREIFRPAIEIGASHIALAHNHPSGDPQPSQADIMLTARVVDAGNIIGIQLLDHIIVAANGWVSLKKLGIL